MTRRSWTSLALLVLLPLCLLSCANPASIVASVEGNFRYKSGDYRSAVAAYSRAFADSKAEPYAAYALGVVYLAMGESSSALVRFKEASSSPSASPELRYRALFNAGVTHFMAGNYSGAASSFRSALETDPSRSEAKGNLELAVARMKKARASSGSAAPVDARQNDGSASTLFDYIREQESDRWKSRQWSQESESWQDY